MNLHGIVRGAITSVNPDIEATLLRSNGYTTDAAGMQIPEFLRFHGRIQVQGISAADQRNTDYLNIQGVLRCVYIRGNWAGVVRADKKGGDILKFAQVPGTAIQDWKVVAVKETWPDWSSVIVWLQVTTV